MSGFFSKLFKRTTIPDGLKQYNGVYHNGKATFQYSEREDGERCFEGSFTYKGVSGNRDVLVKGQYNNNQKEGLWVYKMTSPDYKKQISAEYVEGQINGHLEYECVESRFYNGMRTVVTFQIKDGKVVGDISGTFGEAILTAQSDEESRADGRWQMVLKDKDNGDRIDVELWEHGVLKETFALDGFERSKRKTYPRLRGLVNDILDNELRKMLGIIGRGELTQTLHVNAVK